MKRIVFCCLLFLAVSAYCSEEHGEKYFVDVLKAVRAAIDSGELDTAHKLIASRDPNFKLDPKLFERILKSMLQQTFEHPEDMKLLKFTENKDRAILVYRSDLQSKTSISLKSFVFERKDDRWIVYYDSPIDFFKTMGAEEDDKAIRQSLAENPGFDISKGDPLRSDAANFTASRHPEKVNVPEFLNKMRDALVPEDVMLLIQKQAILDQSDETKKQWQAFLSKIKLGVDDQRGALLKSGLMASATGDCKLALQTMSILLDPVLSISRRINDDLGTDDELKKAWRPVYELIQKEQFVDALAKMKEARLGELESNLTQKNLKKLRARLEDSVRKSRAPEASK